MTEKIPTFIARKATKEDLKRLNEIHPSTDGSELQEKDLEKMIVLEINGKVRGMLFYNPEKQTFSEATANPLIRKFVAGIAKSDFNKEKNDEAFKKLLKKYGAKKLAQMYEAKIDELTKKDNPQ